MLLLAGLVQTLLHTAPMVYDGTATFPFSYLQKYLDKMRRLCPEAFRILAERNERAKGSARIWRTA